VWDQRATAASQTVYENEEERWRKEKQIENGRDGE